MVSYAHQPLLPLPRSYTPRGRLVRPDQTRSSPTLLGRVKALYLTYMIHSMRSSITDSDYRSGSLGPDSLRLWLLGSQNNK